MSWKKFATAKILRKKLLFITLGIEDSFIWITVHVHTPFRTHKHVYAKALSSIQIFSSCYILCRNPFNSDFLSNHFQRNVLKVFLELDLLPLRLLFEKFFQDLSIRYNFHIGADPGLLLQWNTKSKQQTERCNEARFILCKNHYFFK